MRPTLPEAALGEAHGIRPAYANGKNAWGAPVRLFEALLWRSRLFAVVAVVTSFVLWLVMLFITTVDAFYLVQSVLGYADPALGTEGRVTLRAHVIGGVIGVLDGYLIASALFIFTLGLYRQFINRLAVAEGTEVGNRLLDTNSYKDLKGRLANTIVLILIVKFLRLSLGLTYSTMGDVVLLAFGTLLIGGALYLSHTGTSH